MTIFVKICGVTTEEDALLAVAMGADALGFIFAPSTRQVRPAQVADIIKRLPPEILTVGVFRDETPQRVIEVVNATGLTAAQLSGHESPVQTKLVAERVRFVIKGFSATDPALERATDYGAHAVLMDAPTPGSGQLFDWLLTGRVPARARLLLAGGLTPANVAEGIAKVQPWGVDVATGVESSPGHKDPVKLRAFIAAAKAAVVERRPRPEPDPAEERPYDWRNDG